MDSKSIFKSDISAKKSMEINKMPAMKEKPDGLESIMRMATLMETDMHEGADDSFMDEMPLVLNKDLVKTGCDMFNAFEENEIISDTDESISLECMAERPVVAPKTRLRRFREYEQMTVKEMQEIFAGRKLIKKV